jgi:thiosulfate dehydrogenase
MKFTGGTMNTQLSPLLLAVLASAAMAQTPATKGVPIQPLEAYDVSKLPDDHYGRLARYGKELTDRTFAHIGPQAKNPAMRYAGNNLACSSCHQASATKAFAMPWVGVHASFPQYRAREDEVSTVEERINGCMERSMAGKPLPLDSTEMKAFMTYIHFLSKDVPTGAKVEGQGLPPFKAPNRRADTVAGGQVYAAKCAVCHGTEGQGLRTGAPGEGYTFPPLWGADSFNNGAGMGRLLFASAFIKTNMPLGAQHGQPQLSDDEAYDVAAFMLSHPRPQKANLERDFPARWNKPVDAAFPPYVDGAPADQHKFGPFAPLQENLKQLKNSLLKASGR